MKNLILILITMYFSVVANGQKKVNKDYFFKQEILNNSNLNKDQKIAKEKYKNAFAGQVIGGVGAAIGGIVIVKGIRHSSGVIRFFSEPTPEEKRLAEEADNIQLIGAITVIASTLIILMSTAAKDKTVNNYFDENAPKVKEETIGFKLKMDSNKLSFTYQF